MKQGGTQEPDGTGGGHEQQETTRRSGIAYAAGLTIFFAVLSFMGIGWVLDRWLGTSWLMVAGIILGAVVGFYEFIRIISQLNK
jgi:F0F1-type ATP synthase assembly protein I